ncbi:hypothetical protein EPN87_03910 [archaeon]|nr:MAG: hypothetical protein EPN87_03910 [archaeon]
MANKNTWMVSGAIIAVLLAVVAYMGYQFYVPQTGAVTYVPSTVFEGKITNVEVEPGIVSGVGMYDRNCIGTSDGMTNCDGGIKTSKYGVLNFHYVHDMAIEPCIAPGDSLQVEIIDAAGNSIVTRSGASGHHG